MQEKKGQKYKARQKNSHKNDSSYYDDWGSMLPPPSLLESYEELSPGFASRLIKFLGREQSHRHSMEEKWLVKLSHLLCFAQIISAMIMILSFVFGTVLFFHDAKLSLILSFFACGVITFVIFSVFVMRSASVSYVNGLMKEKGKEVKGGRDGFKQKSYFFRNKLKK